ncbi:MAG: HD domain-containing protein [Butyrivibrio sp.]|nr:HD domain-containing protein [Butyrivibrio sp.]
MDDIISKNHTRPAFVDIFVFIGLIVTCVIINAFGAFLANSSGLPIYFDLVGTFLAAMLGGFLPGIFVGLLGPVLTAATSDPMAMSYTMLNISIAIITTWLYENGWLKKIEGIFTAIVLDAFIGGVFGAVITWFIYGFEGESTSSDLVSGLYHNAGLPPFIAEIIGDFVVDLADKAITLSVALVIISFMSDKFKSIFKIQAWRQAPLTNETLLAIRKKKSRQLSLRIKVVALIACAAVVIGISAIYIGYITYFNSAIDRQTQFAESTAELAASMVDGNRIDDFLEKGIYASGYKNTKDNLTSIRKSSDYIEYVYVYKIMEDGCHVVFDVDANDTPASQPGDIIEFDPSFAPNIPTLLEGGRIKPIISNDKYGWLLTIYEPIMDVRGKVTAYAGVDISMNQLRMESRGYLVRVVSTFIGIFALTLALGLYFAEYQVILPLNTMAYTASLFSEKKKHALEETAENFHKIHIATGDETENLYNAFSEMTDENLRYFMEVQKKNETINLMQNSLILVLADMVESRNQNTGDHVKKTSAYTKLIMYEMKKEGIYADQLTDQFISDVARSAPLHDIGKISISDAILNKPGKLDDDEFAKMKSHTTAGAEILDRVIDTMPDGDEGYLNEARRLALYHHEKWDGKGYPTGLAGEEIPLSARIIAVADVFDALVSDRSYKKAFPFEKAIDIIRESSGTHFDPLIAQAFLNVQDKARQVLEEHADVSELI